MHRYYGGDADALFDAVLSRDWQRLAPTEAAEHGSEPGDVAAHAGIGYFLTTSSPEPVTGTISELTTDTYAWLYLWDGDQLRIYGNDHYRSRWQFYNDVWLASSSFAKKWNP